jgi:outer membrane lipoprotein-sorting protein
MKKLFFLLTLVALTARAQDDNDIVNNWIRAQAGIQSFQADFKQTRELKALTMPLVATGKIWFALPDQFRWEVMKPAPTIAVREKDELLIVFPKLKRAEKYSLATLRQGQWKDLMGLLDTGFPRSREEFEQRFHVRKVETVPGGKRLVLQPKSALVEKYMPELYIDVSVPDLTLLGTTMKFIDGSILKNEFTNPRLNQKVDPAQFHPVLGPDYKISEPLAGMGQ